MTRWLLFAATCAATLAAAMWASAALSPNAAPGIRPGFWIVLLASWLPWFIATLLAFRVHHLQQAAARAVSDAYRVRRART